MKAILNILPGNLDAENSTLICHIGEEGFSYAIKDDLQNIYVAAVVFNYEHGIRKSEQEKLLGNTLLKQVELQSNFKKVYTIYSFSESVLMPFELYKSQENNNILKLVHGDMDMNTILLTDIITEYGICNIYRVPENIVNLFKSKFPDVVNRHLYSVLIKQYPPGDDKLFVIYYPQKIIVKLNKDGQTQILNSYLYHTAIDISYILLNICKQFNVYNIPLELSGMIDQESALYAELRKYFETMNFAQLPSQVKYSEEITRNPAHYFSPIFVAHSCE
jgi:hypothetical protein